MNKMNYQLLDTMGISVWEPRFVKLQTQDSNDFVITASPRIYQADCLVVLPERTGSLKGKSKNELLNRMLKVLDIDFEKIMIARIHNDRDKFSFSDWQCIIKKVLSWSPKSLLIFDNNFMSSFSGTFWVKTYHPDYLDKYPKFKRAAYDQLLRLKDHLKK